MIKRIVIKNYNKDMLPFIRLNKSVGFRVVFFLLILFLIFFFTSCETHENENVNQSTSDFFLYVDSKKVDPSKRFIDCETHFISFDLFGLGSLKLDLNIAEYFSEKKYLDCFYYSNLDFEIPSVRKKDSDDEYVDVRYINDLTDAYVLNFKSGSAVFTDRNNYSFMPNAVGILPSGSKYLTEFDGKTKKNDEDIQVYIVGYPFENIINNDVDVFVYANEFGLAKISSSVLEQVREWKTKKFSFKQGEKRTKYKKLEFMWDIIDSYESSFFVIPKEKIKGLDVIVPSSFALCGTQIESLVSKTYIEGAKKNSYMVYAYLSDEGDKVCLENLIASDNKSKKMTDTLLFNLLYNDFDGVNFDLISLNLVDKENFRKFFVDFAEKFHEFGKQISLCVPMESEIDFSSLQSAVDYFFLMAIDEYDSNSKEAGPVSSYSWTKEGIEKYTKNLPSEKLILTTANYVRIFEIEGKNFGDNRVVSSNIISKKDLKSYFGFKIADKNLDYDSLQDIYEFYDKEDDATYKVWVENEDSLIKRLSLVDEFGLGGLAIWKMNFEEEWYRELLIGDN